MGFINKSKLIFFAGVLFFCSLKASADFTPTLLNVHNFSYIIQTPIFTPKALAKISQSLNSAGFDIAGMNIAKGQIEVLTNQKGVEKLQGLGFIGQYSEVSPLMGIDTRYLNPTSLNEKLNALHEAYPNLTRLKQIGTSLQGRPILALLVSNTPLENDPQASSKRSIIFDGVHHAREIMTAEVVADVADYLLTHQTEARAKNILENWMVWVVPILNPDGSNIVFTQSAMWRKNARGDKGQVYGVDINRNYELNWNTCSGASNSKGAQDYRGPSAGSEPETQALMNFVDEIKPTASLSYHSYSELVLYPYGCDGQYSSEKELIAKIAQELANKLPSDNGKGYYTPGTPWELLYSVDGDSMDHIYGLYGTLAYTFEVNLEFQPNYSARMPTLIKHREAWMYYLERMQNTLVSNKNIFGRWEHREIK